MLTQKKPGPIIRGKNAERLRKIQQRTKLNLADAQGLINGNPRELRNWLAENAPGSTTVILSGPAWENRKLTILITDKISDVTKFANEIDTLVENLQDRGIFVDLHVKNTSGQWVAEFTRKNHRPPASYNGAGFKATEAERMQAFHALLRGVITFKRQH